MEMSSRFFLFKYSSVLLSIFFILINSCGERGDRANNDKSQRIIRYLDKTTQTKIPSNVAQYLIVDFYSCHGCVSMISNNLQDKIDTAHRTTLIFVYPGHTKPSETIFFQSKKNVIFDNSNFYAKQNISSEPAILITTHNRKIVNTIELTPANYHEVLNNTSY